jgi:hypothetical protein
MPVLKHISARLSQVSGANDVAPDATERLAFLFEFSEPIPTALGDRFTLAIRYRVGAAEKSIAIEFSRAR